MSKSLFTIRKRKHSKHPQIVVKVSRTKFSSLGLTHSRGKRKQRNKKLKQNPNPQDSRDAYVSRHLLEDFKFNYSKVFNNYALSNEDIDELIRFLESKKKHP